MTMHDPPHPGALVQEACFTPDRISCRKLALKSAVAASTLHRVLIESSGESPEMALRLSKTLGHSPENWLMMQHNCDSWRARQMVDLKRARKIEFGLARRRTRVGCPNRNSVDFLPGRGAPARKG